MLYPSRLKDGEYIRMVALRRNETGTVVSTVIDFVQTFEEYNSFILNYRYTHDVYNQIATNRGNESGNSNSQRLRHVLFLDFDKKDYPDLKVAQDFTAMIKAKMPRLFLHACIDSGHGFHFYVSVKSNVSGFNELVEINKELAEFLGADIKATLSTQISRPPCTFNHKLSDGTYDYQNRDKWEYVTVVNNAYMGGSQFQALDLQYIKSQLKTRKNEAETQAILDKIDWQYEKLDNYPCYLCVQKVLHEGADQGQRNFWHGRIVKYLQMEGYQESKIYSKCQEWNMICRPSKSKNEIEQDTKKYLSENYHLLGCYESIADPVKRKFVEEQCDKANCGTHHNGAKISVETGQPARISKAILRDEDLRNRTGNEYLILTILYVYKDSYGRRGFRVKNLKNLLYSSVQKKQCINDRTLKKLLLELQKKKWVDIVPDKKKPVFDESRIELMKKTEDFRKGYIEFYFSVAGALIDGRINQTHYLVFLTLLRNLSNKKNVTYDQLADDLMMDKQNVGKYIRKLEQERCLVVKKKYNEKGNEYNSYHFINPDFFMNEVDLNDDKELAIQLLA